MIGDIDSLAAELARVRREGDLLESLMRLANLRGVEDEDLRAEALDLIAQLTGSRAAFLFPLDLDGTRLGPPSWSLHGDLDQGTLPVAEAGDWARSAIDEESVVAAEGPLTANMVKGLEPLGVITRLVATPLLGQGSVVGVAGVVDKEEPYTESDRRRLPILFHSLWTILHHSRMERVLEGLRSEDPVTGLPNRDRFEQLTRIEMRRADRAGSPLAIVICDLDGFSAYNAVEGRAAGDRVLRMVGDVMGDAFQRAGDLIARLDDDAFGLLLPATEEDAFPKIGERARDAVDGLRLPHPSSDVADHVTVSVGSALHLPRSGSTATALFAEAWDGVEVARSAGGNLAGHALPEA